ncbi:hypothetical protein [Streptomyces aureus]|uniref:hypothetical protein n=1 Tax=Streptomyces aureus TaxID=193461 RepID=UPI000AB70B78
MELSIGAGAPRSGLSVHTLRFYKREGLFANPYAACPTAVGSGPLRALPPRERFTEDTVSIADGTLVPTRGIAAPVR